MILVVTPPVEIPVVEVPVIAPPETPPIPYVAPHRVRKQDRN